MSDDTPAPGLATAVYAMRKRAEAAEAEANHYAARSAQMQIERDSANHRKEMAERDLAEARELLVAWLDISDGKLNRDVETSIRAFLARTEPKP